MKSILMSLALVIIFSVCGVAKAGEVVTYYYTDAQGTPLVTTDALGNMISIADYRPYATQALGQLANGPGYTGHINDADTSLVYMQARYYDPDIGRFISIDPIAADVDGLNRYVYASNNPYYYSDPTGMQDCSDACMKLRDLSNRLGSLSNDFMTAFGGSSGRGALGSTNAVNNFVQGAGGQQIAAELNDDSAALGAGMELAPGGAAASCMLGGCGPAGWSLGAISLIPGEAEVAGGARFAIGATGRIGEDALRLLGGESQVYFNTSQGARFIDQMIGGVANESKVGYTSLTPSIRSQISKDVELVNSGQIKASVWHFFQSPVTGSGGPSKPLAKVLQQNGINTVVH